MIEFTYTANMRVDFGTLSALQLLQTKTILVWLNISTLTGDIFGLGPSGASDEEWGIALPAAGPPINRLFFYADWSTAQGQWYSTNALTTGIRHLAVSYDYGSTSNDPVMYVDGASVAVTESTAPSGSYRTGTSNSVRLGSFLVGDPAIGANVMSLLAYNRILTAAEILHAYNSKLMIPDRRGLVFAPDLCKAASLQTFDGATLSGTNYIVDQVSGAQGTPSGSPVGRADTYLTVRGY